MNGCRQESDTYGIAFPSDEVRLGAIRKRHRLSFDNNDEQGPTITFFREAGNPVEAMLLFERMLVGTMDRKPHTLIPVEELRRQLIDLYVAYGVASGRKQASEYVRRLEESETKTR